MRRFVAALCLIAVAVADPVCCEYKCKGFDTQLCAPNKFECYEMENCDPPLIREVDNCSDCHKFTDDDASIGVNTVSTFNSEEEQEEEEPAFFHLCCLYTCKGDYGQLHMCANDPSACEPVPDCPDVEIWEAGDCGEHPEITCKHAPPTQYCCKYQCEGGENVNVCSNSPASCDVIPTCSGPVASRVQDCNSDCLGYSEEDKHEEQELFNCCHYECDGEDYGICVPNDIECEPMDGCDGPKIDEGLEDCDSCEADFPNVDEDLFNCCHYECDGEDYAICVPRDIECEPMDGCDGPKIDVDLTTCEDC